MKNFIFIPLAVLPLMLTSCATPRPPQVFRNTDNTALVIKSLDSETCQMVQPTASVPESNDLVLSKAETLPQHQTAIVMLENYTEQRLGQQYRDRGTTLFIALRELGYQHIVFVQGNNVSDPNGLITLVEYF